MKKKLFVIIAVMAVLLLTLTACGKENTYKREIEDAWTKTNGYESASYSYENGYNDEDGSSVIKSIEGAYNRTEEAWSQVSDYGSQGKGKQEEVISPDGIYMRYNLNDEGWGAWTPINGELPEYASYLKTLFAQEISYENIASIEKTEEDGEYLYTLTYKKSYMQSRVADQLEAARSYLEIYEDTASSMGEVDELKAKIENLEKMSNATGALLYYVDKEGNLTGLGSRMEMEGENATYAMLKLWDFDKVSFKGYTENP